MNKDYQNRAKMVPYPAQVAVELELIGRDRPVVRDMIGAWRWPSLTSHYEALEPVLRRSYVIDLGGLAGPIGYGSVIVDYGHDDRKALWDLPGKVDAIFCVHTLEHVEDIDLFLLCCTHKLKPPGQLIIVVPSYKKKKLRHRNWPYHRHTFHVGEDPDAPPESEDLKAVVEQHIPKVVLADYAYDDIIVIAERVEGD